MPSKSLVVHLEELLKDPEVLDNAFASLNHGTRDWRHQLMSLNRAALVSSVSAWESYIEELMRECLALLRPPTPPLTPWPALNAHVLGLIGRFNTPNTANVTNLINSSLGLPDVKLSWAWQGCTPAQAVVRLDDILDYRHRIAHGVNPRPTVHNSFSNSLPTFFRRIARCTDRAVRNHLVSLGVANPWPV